VAGQSHHERPPFRRAVRRSIFRSW
jgi:hypothetical protein